MGIILCVNGFSKKTALFFANCITISALVISLSARAMDKVGSNMDEFRFWPTVSSAAASATPTFSPGAGEDTLHSRDEIRRCEQNESS